LSVYLAVHFCVCAERECAREKGGMMGGWNGGREGGWGE